MLFLRVISVTPQAKAVQLSPTDKFISLACLHVFLEMFLYRFRYMTHIFAIGGFLGQGRSPSLRRVHMLPTAAIVPLVCFVVLLLAAALCGLAASGHFPIEHRSLLLRTGAGLSALYGSLIVVACSVVIGVVIVVQFVPWFAIVIGGGGALLIAPLVLQMFSDRFVNGRAILMIFALLCTGSTACLFMLILR